MLKVTKLAPKKVIQQHKFVNLNLKCGTESSGPQMSKFNDRIVCRVDVLLIAGTRSKSAVETENIHREVRPKQIYSYM